MESGIVIITCVIKNLYFTIILVLRLMLKLIVIIKIVCVFFQVMKLAKPIRENTYLMYYPFTIFGCLTVVRVYKPILDCEGQLKEKKLRKLFFFVHDKELREMFDSYKTICSLSDSGFQPLNFQTSNSDIHINVNTK